MTHVFSHRFSGVQDLFSAHLMPDCQTVLVRTQNKVSVYDLRSRRLAGDFALPYATHQFRGQPGQLFQGRYHELSGDTLLIYDPARSSYEEIALEGGAAISGLPRCHVSLEGQFVLQDADNTLFLVDLAARRAEQIGRTAELTQIQVPRLGLLLLVTAGGEVIFLPRRPKNAPAPPCDALSFCDPESGERVSVDPATATLTAGGRQVQASARGGQLLAYALRDGFLTLAVEGGTVAIFTCAVLRGASRVLKTRLQARCIQAAPEQPVEARELTQPEREQLERQAEVLRAQVLRLQRRLAELDEQNCYLTLQLRGREQAGGGGLAAYSREYRTRRGREPLLAEKIAYLSGEGALTPP